MRKYYLVLIFSTFALSGCSDSYNIQVKTARNGQTAIPQSSKIVVMVDPHVANQKFEKDVKTRIEQTLRDCNYLVVDSLNNADYRLTFETGLESRQESSYQPSMRVGGVVLPVTVWDQKLDIKLYQQDMKIWEGQSYITERYPEEQKNISYLIVAIFEYFDKDSAGRKSVPIKVNDPRVAALNSLKNK